jgi:hypothetical protein
MTMRIFDHGIIFKHWGEIYAGHVLGFAWPESVLKFGESGKIAVCSEERLVQLHLALEESTRAFWKLIRLFVKQDGDPQIDDNIEDESAKFNRFIPQVYFAIWELEFLLRLQQDDTPEWDRILKALDWSFSSIGHKEWKNFIRIERGKPIILDTSALAQYIDNKIMLFQSR